MVSKSNTTIDSYNKTAKDYYDVVSKFETLSEFNVFVNKVKPEGKILDLGCGPGHHSKLLLENGFDVDGIDLSPEMISIAKEEELEGNFQVMDILDLKFEKNTFNGIWASASLIHISKTNLKPVLKQLKKILVKEGVLYISLKKGEGSELLKDKRYSGVEKYYVYYQLEDFVKILKDIGFKVTETTHKKKRDFYDTNSWLHIFCEK